jgi:hypothetical protein
LAAKKSYNRYFIIFQEEDKGYGMGPDRPPTGYVKVETRNDKSKVTVYVQNLKPFESGECLYKCYLIGHHDGKGCSAYLGTVNIDDLGRGESSWETGYENAFNSSTSIDKFNGAAIIAQREESSGIIAPLAGYMSKEKFDWRSVIPAGKQAQKVNEDNLESTQDAKEEQEVLTDEAAKFQEYEESILKPKEPIESEKPAESEDVPAEDMAGTSEPETAQIEEDVKEDIRIEENEYENVDEPSKENVAYESEDTDSTETVQKIENADKKDDDIRSKHKEHKHDYHDYYKYDCRNILRRTLEGILSDYEKIDKHKELKDCSIWKVDMRRYKRDVYKVNMYPCYDLVFYPMVNNPQRNYYKYIRKHGHYLFGIKHGKDGRVAAIIYGIPGRKTSCDQPFEGSTGFTKWVSWDGDRGYWMMMYDPMTGMIISQR